MFSQAQSTEQWCDFCECSDDQLLVLCDILPPEEIYMKAVKVGNFTLILQDPASSLQYTYYKEQIDSLFYSVITEFEIEDTVPGWLTHSSKPRITRSPSTATTSTTAQVTVSVPQSPATTKVTSSATITTTDTVATINRIKVKNVRITTPKFVQIKQNITDYRINTPVTSSMIAAKEVTEHSYSPLKLDIMHICFLIMICLLACVIIGLGVHIKYKQVQRRGSTIYRNPIYGADLEMQEISIDGKKHFRFYYNLLILLTFYIGK